MPFVLYAAADLYGSKINLELDFPSFPSVAEIIAQCQAAFSYEASIVRPAHLPLQVFSVSRVQVYREEEGTWHDLISPAQLREFSQLYIIQSDPRIQETQQQIPPAKKPSRPVVSSSAAGSLSRVAPTSPGRYAPSSNNSAAGVYGSPLVMTGSGSPVPRTAAIPTSSSSSYHQSPPRNVAAVPLTVGSTTATPSAGSPAPLARFGTIRGPDAVGQQDKIRYVFEEMDRNGNRLIEPDEFRDLLRALNIDFSSATVTDLFRKGDVDRDGVWSMAEFAQFFSAYTTLLDSLYFRLRDVAEGRQLQQELATERQLLDQTIDRRARAIHTAQEGAVAVEQQAGKLRHSESDRAVKAARENELRGLLVQCDDDLRHAAAQRNGAAGEYELQRDREKQAQVLANATTRDATDAEARLGAEQGQLAKAQEKERQLQQLLLEAQRETERQHKIVYEAQLAVAQNRDREQHALAAVDAAQKEVNRANDRLSACEREVILKNERQKELSKVLNEVQVELSRLAQRVDDDRRDLATLEDRDRGNRHLVQESDVNVQQQERRLHDKDQEIVLFSQRRAAMELQEKPLLEQEVRLREQRDNLEEKEIRLRREAVSYFDGSRSVAQPVVGSSPVTNFRSVSPPRR